MKGSNHYYRKYIPEFVYKIINFGYNIYYKFSGKKILTQKDRYELNQLIFSDDIESERLGMSLLTEFYTGTDLVADCSLRITWDEDRPEELRHYFTFGDLKMSESLKIQTVIDEIKNVLKLRDFLIKFHNIKE